MLIQSVLISLYICSIDATSLSRIQYGQVDPDNGIYLYTPKALDSLYVANQFGGHQDSSSQVNSSCSLDNLSNKGRDNSIETAPDFDQYIFTTDGLNGQAFNLQTKSPPKIETNSDIETFTNNHQQSNNLLVENNHFNHDSRHYNSYSHSILAPPAVSNYNKLLHSFTGSNAFTNKLNLNYIHNLLTKPITSASQNLFDANKQQGGNNLALASTHHSQVNTPNIGFLQTISQLANSNKLSRIHAATGNQQQPQQNEQPAVVTPISNDINGDLACGRQQVGHREPRIVGGNSTYEGEFPWAVSIQRHGNHHCGGVIVGRRWILTAAHCVRSQSAGNLIVRTGGHTLVRSSNHINSHLERDHFIDLIVMHDDFSRSDNLTNGSPIKSSANTNNADIALLKLKHDIHWNELVWPVCFPHREAGNFSGHDAVVIGWGKLNEKSEDFSNELQKVKLTVIDNKVCQNWFKQAGREIPIDDRIICAGFKNGGKDACHGDSGGPLLSKINGQYVVVGVVSTGIGCARPLLPGLYSRVSSYINWIERYVTAA